MPKEPVEVAIAVLYRDGKFLMQLRDNIPGILYPGFWGFFGGHLEPGETPEIGIFRELEEEISYRPPLLMPFDCYADEQVIRHIFHGEVTVEKSQLQLNEGWDLDFVPPAAVQQGEYYSQNAQQVRPLGPIHRQILLDFMAKKPFP